MRHLFRSDRLCFVVLTGLYVFVRLWHLTETCLWFDEIFSVHAASQSWNKIFFFVASDVIHPPLFYCFLKIWIAIGGESLLWLRLLPTAFSFLALIPFTLICREIKLGRAAFCFALLILAVNGSLIKYSQEVRMYSLFMLLCFFSIWLFTRFFNRGIGSWLLITINILLIYTHYFGAILIFAEFAAIAAFQPIKIRQALVHVAAIAAAFLPWVLAVTTAATAADVSVSQNIGWMARPGLFELGGFVLSLVEPFYFAVSTADRITTFRVAIPLLAILIISITYALVSKRDRNASTGQLDLIVFFSIVTVGTAFILSWLLPWSVWGTRHMILVFGLTAIIFGYVLDRLPNKTLKMAVVSMTLLFVIYGGWIESRRPARNPSWCGWEHLVGELPEASGARIFAFEDLVAYQLWYAGSHARPELAVTRVSGIEGVHEDRAYFLPRAFDGVERSDGSGFSEPVIWIAYRAKGFDIIGPPISELQSRGYTVAERYVYEADDEKAILVKLVKKRALN